jgi:hypothetical protein
MAARAQVPTPFDLPLRSFTQAKPKIEHALGLLLVFLGHDN